jgi:hypothetical protein
MALISASTGKTLLKTEEKKLFGLEDKSAETGEKRTIKLKGINCSAKVKGVLLFLDGKEGKVIASVWLANEATSSQMFASAGAPEGIEISTGELYVEAVTASCEAYATAYIEE